MYKNFVKKIKKELSINTPVNLENLISKFSDIEILYNQHNDDGDLACSEIINGIYTIKVNDSKLTDKNKYWIAVELGHIVLHHLDNYPKLYNNYNNELIYEAEEFARELFMSEDEFRKVVYENSECGVCDLIAVSEYFKVDPEIVSVKGKLLRLFS